MDEERLVKRVYSAGVSGRRPRGRPRLGWMEGVGRALGNRGLTLEDGKERAFDRDEWRAIVGMYVLTCPQGVARRTCSSHVGCLGSRVSAEKGSAPT